MTTLVTGASGFVGSAVLRRLVDAGHQVRALVRPTSDRRNLAGVECEIATGDLDDRAALDRAVAGCDALFHVAADYRLWVTDAAAMYRSNVEGTRQLMLAAAEAGVRRIVYTSSVATLGLRPDGRPADEATAAASGDMIGHYKKSKFFAEAEVRRLIETAGLPAVIVKPSTPFGPRDVKPTPTGRVVVEAAAGRMPAYVDTGLNVVHVEDVAAGHLLAFERGGLGESYILGGEDMTLRALLETVAALAGRRPPRLRVPHWAVLPVAYAAEALARRRGRGDPIVTVDGVRMSKKRMYFSSDKARRDLGYAPRPGAEALRDALDWFRAGGYLD
ncbi:MAG: hopanoid-associated sugar epimerase [Dongiaceae bacterium]